jgi:hypothetical protein
VFYAITLPNIGVVCNFLEREVQVNSPIPNSEEQKLKGYEFLSHIRRYYKSWSKG